MDGMEERFRRYNHHDNCRMGREEGLAQCGWMGTPASGEHHRML